MNASASDMASWPMWRRWRAIAMVARPVDVVVFVVAARVAGEVIGTAIMAIAAAVSAGWP